MFSIINKFLIVECRLWRMNPSLESVGWHFKDLYSCSFCTISKKIFDNLSDYFLLSLCTFCNFFYKGTISWFAQGIQIQRTDPASGAVRVYREILT